MLDGEGLGAVVRMDDSGWDEIRAGDGGCVCDCEGIFVNGLYRTPDLEMGWFGFKVRSSASR